MCLVCIAVPTVEFDAAKVTVNETAGTVSVPIKRSGDLSCKVSVICYTRQQSASVMQDYTERVGVTVYHFFHCLIVISLNDFYASFSDADQLIKNCYCCWTAGSHV